MGRGDHQHDEEESEVLIKGRYYNEDESTAEEAEIPRLSIDQAIVAAGFGKFQYLMVAVMGWANSADAIELLSVSYILPNAICELEPTGLETGFLTAVGFAGMMLGAYFWGALADVKGRRNVLIMCQTVNALFIVASAFTPSFWYLVLMRLLSGFGVGGTNPLLLVYLVEFLPPDQRGKMIGFWGAFFMVGQVLIAGLAWLIIPQTTWGITSGSFVFNSWRIFLLISAFPVISSIVMFLLFPESPRFLVERNRMEEAMTVLRKVHKVNNTKTKFPVFNIKRPDGMAEYKPIIGWKNYLKEMFRRSASLVTRRDVRSKFIVSSIIMFCLSSGYYGLTMWFPMLFEKMEAANGTSVCAAAESSAANTTAACFTKSEVYFDSFLQALSSLPGNLFFYFCIDRVGRKLVLGLSMLGSAVSLFFIWLVTSKVEAVALSCVFAGVSVLAWNCTSLITAEIFPTELRSTAKGVQGALVTRIGSIVATVVFGALINTHCAVPILLIAALFIIGGLVTYKLPNTNNIEIN